jgi:hypothetical protein
MAGSNRFVAGTGLVVTGGAGKHGCVFRANSGLLTLQDFSLAKGDAAKGDALTVDKALQGSLQQASDGQGGTMLSFGTAGHGVGRPRDRHVAKCQHPVGVGDPITQCCGGDPPGDDEGMQATACPRRYRRCGTLRFQTRVRVPGRGSADLVAQSARKASRSYARAIPT